MKFFLCSFPHDQSLKCCPLLVLIRDSYLGRIAAGRVASGVLRVGDKIRVLRHRPSDDVSGSVSAAVADDAPETKVTRIFKRVGMERVAVDEAVAGDIVAVAGSEAAITDTLAGPGTMAALDPGHIDPPTLRWRQFCDAFEWISSATSTQHHDHFTRSGIGWA